MLSCLNQGFGGGKSCTQQAPPCRYDGKPVPSEDISEIDILPIRSIFKGMDHVWITCLGHLGLKESIFLPILLLQPPSKQENSKEHDRVAHEMYTEGNKVPRSVPGQEDLRT